MDILDLPITENKIRYNVKALSNKDNKMVNLFNEQSISLEEKYFDIDNQILNYNYNEYFNNIKKYIHTYIL
jgi:hypothetical protein